MKKWKAVLKRIILEPLRFLTISVIVLLYQHLFIRPIVGAPNRCGGVLCPDGSHSLYGSMCADGSSPYFSTVLWDGYCLSKMQGYITITLFLLLLVPLITATLKHTISKLWLIYALFPTVILILLTFQMMR